MDSVGFTVIVNAVSQVHVQVPAFAFLHGNPLFFDEEGDVRIRDNWHVEADFAILVAKAVIAMVSDTRSRFEPEQTYRGQRAGKSGQDLPIIWAAVEPLSIGEGIDRGRIRIELVRLSSDRAQRHAAPLAFVYLTIEVRNPFVGLDLREIGSETIWIKRKGKLQRG